VSQHFSDKRPQKWNKPYYPEQVFGKDCILQFFFGCFVYDISYSASGGRTVKHGGPELSAV
jgi:hypothetical protein